MAEPEIARRIADLPPEERAKLFEKVLLRRKPRSETPSRPPLLRHSRDDFSFLLSFAQQRLWFLNLYEPDSPEYNVPQTFRIEGVLDPELLEGSLNGVVSRHESLRTTFVSQEGTPYQRVAPAMRVALPCLDLTHQPEEEAWEVAMEGCREDAAQPFDLAAGPLLRGRLYRVAEEGWVLYLNVHHIANDQWSMGVLARELAEFYAAGAEKRAPDLPELPVQYLDYGLWQREWLSGEELERQVDFWRRRLGSVPPLDLPTDRPRPAVRTFAGNTLPLALAPGLGSQLGKLAAAESATLFMVLSAAFKALLHHYTAQEDFAVGTLIANRRLPQVEDLIGFFANTLVLRTDLAGDPPFSQLIEREREVALDAFAHQDLPFEKLIDELNPPRDTSRTPLCQAMLILLNAPGEPLHLPGAELAPVALDNRTSKMEMTLYLAGEGDGLGGYLEYNRDLFDRATIERFLGHFHTLLESCVADPNLPLSRVPLLAEEERRHLLFDLNDTTTPAPTAPLHHLLAARCAASPEATAVEVAGEKLTYGDLERRSNRLARYLARRGVGPEVLVGLCVERSLDMVVALLAVLKAGGGYVPLDPEYPASRLERMLGDSRAPVVVTQTALIEKLPPNTATIVTLDKDGDGAAIAAESAEPFDGGASLSSLAYVIYTSGSTGTPKGVQISHLALVNFLRSMERSPGFTAADSLLGVTTLSFDIAGLELYLPLLAGGRLVLAARDEAQAGERLVELLDRSEITVMQATPATWRLLLGAGWSGDPNLKVLCGGEALPEDLAAELVAKAGEVWNVYGPTEATIWSTLDRLEPVGKVSIGLPLDNTQVHLLAPGSLLPVPLGVPGELLIGGLGLARGYRGLPAMTADRFVPDPHSEVAGARLYRTGDLARRFPDGRLECLGRIDHQVKVRGFRIELGEIEVALASHDGVAQTVVLAREDTPGSKRLVAYWTGTAGSQPPSTADLKNWIQQSLPDYMVPAFFVPLDELPLTPNGKTDRLALPAPDASAAQALYVAPRNADEEKMADIWADLLKLERVGVHDDFFDLGGDSLLVVRVVTKAAKAGVTITTKQAFEHKTISELIAAAGSVDIIAEQAAVVGHHPWTPAQLHFQELRHPNEHFHSTGNLLEIRQGAIDPVVVRRALQVMQRHHDTLRMRMVEEPYAGQTDVGAYQLGANRHLIIEPVGRLPALRYVDLSGLPQAEHETHMTTVARETVTGYDLARGPLFRAVIFELEPGCPRQLFLSAHFYPVDLGSWIPLLDDFDTVYGQLLAGEEVQLQPKTTSAVDWAKRLQERALNLPDAERKYWLEQAPLKPTRIPMDHQTGPNDWTAARVERMVLSAEDTEILLSHAPRAFGVQIDGIMVTAILEAFAEWVKAREFPIVLLGHGREPLYDDMDISRTVGWFNSLYPINVVLGPEAQFDDVARFVNRQLREVPHGGMGYGSLKYLGGDQEAARHLRAAAWPQIFFNYVGSDNSKELRSFKKLEQFGGYFLDVHTQRLTPIVLTGMIVEDELLLKWEWSVNLHNQETILALLKRCREVIDWFLTEYRRREAARGVVL